MSDLAVVPEKNKTKIAHKGKIFGVTDVGSTKVITWIFSFEGHDTLKILGCGWHKSEGINNGNITNLFKAENVLCQSVAEAEKDAKVRLKTIYTNLSCGIPKSQLLNVQWSIGGRKINENDILDIQKEGRKQATTETRYPVHIFPIKFELDETTEVKDPCGLYSYKILAGLHIIDANRAAMINLEHCVNRADLELEGMVSAPISAGCAVLTDDERILGTTLVDLGGGTTSLALFLNDVPVYTATLPIGGEHITSDIANYFSVTMLQAETIKTRYGSADRTSDSDEESIPILPLGEELNQPQFIHQKALRAIIRPRLEEILDLVNDRIENSGFAAFAKHRIVFTGGGANIDGLIVLAEKVFEKSSIRIGKPSNIINQSKLYAGADRFLNPLFSTIVGMALYIASDGSALTEFEFISKKNRSQKKRGFLSRIAEFLQERA